MRDTSSNPGQDHISILVNALRKRLSPSLPLQAMIKIVGYTELFGQGTADDLEEKRRILRKGVPVA